MVCTSDEYDSKFRKWSEEVTLENNVICTSFDVCNRLLVAVITKPIICKIIIQYIRHRGKIECQRLGISESKTLIEGTLFVLCEVSISLRSIPLRF